jgi:toxin ParE1/3/4
MRKIASACRLPTMSVRERRLAAEARKDIRAILRYSKQEWGVRQQGVYAAQIDEAIDRLCLFPEIGHFQPETPSGFWSFPVGEHIIYYRFGPKRLTILRVLHKRMDALTRLTR